MEKPPALSPEVDRLEFLGTNYTGPSMATFLEELDDQVAGNVTVVFKNGLRTSLSKVVASQGATAVRVEDGKVFI